MCGQVNPQMGSTHTIPCVNPQGRGGERNVVNMQHFITPLPPGRIIWLPIQAMKHPPHVSICMEWRGEEMVFMHSNDLDHAIMSESLSKWLLILGLIIHTTQERGLAKGCNKLWRQAYGTEGTPRMPWSSCFVPLMILM